MSKRTAPTRSPTITAILVASVASASAADTACGSNDSGDSVTDGGAGEGARDNEVQPAGGSGNGARAGGGVPSGEPGVGGTAPGGGDPRSGGGGSLIDDGRCASCEVECTDAPRLVGTVTMGLSRYGNVAVAGSDLFVPSATGSDTGVARLSLAASSAESTQVVSDAVSDVGVDGGFLYYSVVGIPANRLLRRPIDGGLSTSIATGISSNMRFDGTDVLTFRGEEFGTFSTTDGSFTRRFSTARPSSGWRTDGRWVYWAKDTASDAFELRRAPLAGGTVETLGTVRSDSPTEPSRRMGFALHDGHLYWADGPNARLRRLPAAGGDPETVWSSPGYTSAVLPAKSEVLLTVMWHGKAPAAQAERGIWAWDPASQTQRQVVGPFPGDADTAVSHPLLVTDNGCIVFQHTAADRTSTHSWDIYVVAL